MRGFIGSVLMAALALPAAAQVIVETPPERPTFGVRITEGGILAESVDEGSLAARSGLRAGDVIVQFAGRRIFDLESIRAAKDEAPADEDVTVVVARGPSLMDEQDLTLRFAATGRRSLGVVVREGLRIVGVNPGSVAERAGVRGGDFLVSFGELTQPTFSTLRDVIARVPRDGVVPVVVYRDGGMVELKASFAAPAAPGSPGAPDAPAPPAPPGEHRGEAAIGVARAELERAIELLRDKTEDPRIAAALKSIEKAREALDRVSTSRAAPPARFRPFNLGEGPDGAALTERFPGFERLLSLLSENMDPERLQDVMRREFPNLQLSIHADEDGELSVDMSDASDPAAALRWRLDAEHEARAERERIEGTLSAAAAARERAHRDAAARHREGVVRHSLTDLERRRTQLARQQKEIEAQIRELEQAQRDLEAAERESKAPAGDGDEAAPTEAPRVGVGGGAGGTEGRGGR